MLFVSANQHPDRVRAMLGHPAWLEDPKWEDPAIQFDPDTIGEFDAYFLPWCLDRTKREIWALAREHRVLCGPLFTVEELYADEHFRDRDFFASLDHPDVGRVEAPGRAVLMSATPWRISRPAPRLGQHTREVLAQAGLASGEIDALVASGAASASGAAAS